jgi:hypothetical protein
VTEKNGAMSKFTKIFNEFIDAWEDLKKAQKKVKVGEMSSEEFFDIDWHFDEVHRKFIKELQK